MDSQCKLNFSKKAINSKIRYGKEIVGPNWAEITITIIMKQLVLPIITVVLLSLSKVDYQLIKVAYILTMLPPSQTNIFFAK